VLAITPSFSTRSACTSLIGVANLIIVARTYKIKQLIFKTKQMYEMALGTHPNKTCQKWFFWEVQNNMTLPVLVLLMLDVRGFGFLLISLKA